MPDRDQGDHWDFLAADLGATPPQKKEEEEQPAEPPAVKEELRVVEELSFEDSMQQIEEAAASESVEPPPAKEEKRHGGQKGGRVVSGFGYRRGGVDWANLARELGVEASEQAPEPIPAADTASEAEELHVSISETPVVVEDRGERRGRPSRPTEPAPRPAAGGFGAGILADVVPEEAEPVDAGRETGERVEDEESQEERKGRRRRRRRKPRRPEEERAGDTTGVEEVKAAEDAVSEESSESDEEEGRRRGRRRGGRKRGPREERSSKSDDFGSGLVADHPGKNDTDDFDMLLDDEQEGDEDEEDFDDEDSDLSPEERANQKRQGKRIAHRGIPSWEEAVGHIIDSNMESRSKRPEPSGPRQHSNRRRGGDRNGNRKRS